MEIREEQKVGLFLLGVGLACVVLTSLLLVVGDFVVHIPLEQYRTYNTTYMIVLFSMVFASHIIASRIPKDEKVLEGRMPLVLFCGILMIVLSFVLAYHSRIYPFRFVSPESQWVPIPTVSSGLSIFCWSFGAYCISLARRIWRGKRSVWS